MSAASAGALDPQRGPKAVPYGIRWSRADQIRSFGDGPRPDWKGLPDVEPARDDRVRDGSCCIMAFHEDGHAYVSFGVVLSNDRRLQIKGTYPLDDQRLQVPTEDLEVRALDVRGKVDLHGQGLSPADIDRRARVPCCAPCRRGGTSKFLRIGGGNVDFASHSPQSLGMVNERRRMCRSSHGEGEHRSWHGKRECHSSIHDTPPMEDRNRQQRPRMAAGCGLCPMWLRLEARGDCRAECLA